MQLVLSFSTSSRVIKSVCFIFLRRAPPSSKTTTMVERHKKNISVVTSHTLLHTVFRLASPNNNTLNTQVFPQLTQTAFSTSALYFPKSIF